MPTILNYKQIKMNNTHQSAKTGKALTIFFDNICNYFKKKIIIQQADHFDL